MKGLIHIYYGDGKGKTTSAVGLAVRAKGAGKKVLFSQFLKSGNSCEIGVLKEIFDVIVEENKHGFFYTLCDDEKKCVEKECLSLFEKAMKLSGNCDLLILDEILDAINLSTIKEDLVYNFLLNKPHNLEVVLTGRNPSKRLIDIASYVTEMKKQKHPFDNGHMARHGIEY